MDMEIINIFTQVGFPVAVTIYLLTVTTTRLEKLTNAITDLKIEIQKLETIIKTKFPNIGE